MLSSADWFWALFGEVEYDDWGIDSRYLTTIGSALLRVWFRGVGVGVREERSRVMIGAVVPSGCKCFYYATYYTYCTTVHVLAGGSVFAATRCKSSERL